MEDRRLRFSSDADIVRLTNARIIIIIINDADLSPFDLGNSLPVIRDCSALVEAKTF